MKSKKTLYFSTTFAAFFIAAFVMVNFNSSTISAQQLYDNDNELIVVSTSPSDGDTDVARNVVIEVTFSEEIDSSSFNSDNFTLMQGRESVTGTFEYSDKKGMFTTEKSLKADSEYTASFRMANQQSDYETNESYSENDNTWSFTTGGNSARVEKIDLGNAGGYVILTQASLNNGSSSDITGETGFSNSSDASDNEDTIYWIKNEDIDREATQRDTTADRHNMEMNMNHRNDDTFSRNSESDEDMMDRAFEDMKMAYSEAEERTPVDFVDFRFSNSHDQSENDRSDRERDYDRDNNHNMNPSYPSNNELQENQNARPWPATTDDSANRDSVSSPSLEAGMNNNETVTLEPGIYKWDQSVEISADITLSGSADDVWIFQISDDLTLNRDVEITLSDGAVAENIFWQIGGDVNLEESSHFEGIILSLNEVTLKSGASVNGRILTQENITLNDNTITEPDTMQPATSVQTID